MLGERLGTWVIFKEIGRGGMGHVYLAQEELTGRKAAVKILSAELAQEKGFLLRFQREIDALSRLQHPNIVRFLESGCENAHYYYAMEYVDGASLEEILDQQGRLPWREVLAIAEQITPALRHVHDHGVIHRDLKPSNILRAVTGEIKLADFGIAKVFAAPHLTKTNAVVGTAEFLSPEQAGGKVVGKRSDIYSLGVVLYFLITGRPPFTGRSYVDLLHKHRFGQFDRPSLIVPELPPELDDLVCSMLEKEPDKRPHDCFVLGKQLATLRRKLERKGSPTVVEKDAMTVDAVDPLKLTRMEGPATLAGRLVRRQLEEQQRGGPIRRLLAHPLFVAPALAVVLGVLAWTFWPMSSAQLYERGAELMAQEHIVDKERAWREYLEPLNRQFPDHPYQAEVQKLREQLDDARHPVPSEAQRFYQRGEMLRQQGDLRGAQATWANVVEAFGDVEEERKWVERCRRSLHELERTLGQRDRLAPLRRALRRLDQLQRDGKAEEAAKLRRALTELYEPDPAAAPLLPK